MDERPELGDERREPAGMIQYEQAPPRIICDELRQPVDVLRAGDIVIRGGVDERVVQVHDEDQLPRPQEARQVAARRLRREHDRVGAGGAMGNGGGGVVCSAPSSRIFRVEISLLFPGDSTRVRSGPCTGVVLHLSPQIHPTSGGVVVVDGGGGGVHSGERGCRRGWRSAPQREVCGGREGSGWGPEEMN
jgi:hypothetical protein